MTTEERVEKLEKAVDDLLKILKIQIAAMNNLSEAVKSIQGIIGGGK